MALIYQTRIVNSGLISKDFREPALQCGERRKRRNIKAQSRWRLFRKTDGGSGDLQVVKTGWLLKCTSHCNLPVPVPGYIAFDAEQRELSLSTV